MRDGTTLKTIRPVRISVEFHKGRLERKKKNEYIYSLFFLIYMLELVTCSGHRIADHRHEFRVQFHVLLHDRPQNECFYT